MKETILNANLIKKYHQDIVFNYAEYPTKDHWSFKFNSDDYKEGRRAFMEKRPPRFQGR